MLSITPVTLKGWGVELAPLSLEHCDGLRKAAADGQLWTLRVTSVPTLDSVEAYVQTALDGQRDGHMLPFVVKEHRTDGQVDIVGSTRYHDILAAVDRVEIGYTWYAKSRQRSHVNTACKLLLMRHAFETLNCEVVGWRTDIFNAASQRAIERLGAKRDGTIRHHAMRRDSTVRDTVMYSLLKSEWPSVRAKLLARLETPAEGSVDSPLNASHSPSAIDLIEVTQQNLQDVLRLEPGALGSRFVASAAISIAQAAYSPNAWVRALSVEGQVRGLLLLFDPTLAPQSEEPQDVVWVWRLLVDFQYHGKGYGKQALEAAIAYARSRPGIREVRISHVDQEGHPGALYQAQGFQYTGRINEGELEMSLMLQEA